MRGRSLAFLFSLLLCLPASARTNPFSYPVQTIFVDPGHGGKDGGAVRNYSWGTVEEKEIVLDVASQVAAKLKAQKPEWHVIMTRSEDVFVPLSKRCEIAYETPLAPKSSALFVSIHVNSAANNSAKGFEVLVRDPQRESVMISRQTPRENIPLFCAHTDRELNALLTQRGAEVAHVVNDELARSFSSRGVKEQDVQVLRESRTPAILIEIGFLTNEEEARSLMDDSWREKMASSIAFSILKAAEL